MKVFEPFRLDATNHCLWRAEERLPLTPKAFDVLRYLVDHSDRLVTQEEILEALWPETYVNPEGIRKYILEIRKVLGDRPDQPEFIETLPKRGYQFVATVTDERPAPSIASAVPSIGKFVGRETSLAQLAAHLETAMSGQRQVVFVTGEAGIGKTTLLDVFHQNASGYSNLRIARGQCIEGFGGKEAYYPMLEAVGSLVQNEDHAAWIETLAKRAPTWLIQFPSLVKAEQRDSLQREILGSTRGRMVREICEALEVMTAQTPLVLILEDLHWVDPSTLDLISAIARRREPAKLLVIATYRPVDVLLSQSPLKPLKQDLLVRHLCHEIAIERLAEPDVAAYLSKEFADSRFPPGLAHLIHHNSGGNALFMSAIVRDIVKRGLIVHEGGQWALTAPLPDVYPGIPETLQQMLEIQFDQLEEEEQGVLESCSVIGERFSLWAAALLMETTPEALEEACDRLAQRKQFIRFAGIHTAANGAESAYYEFRHSLYRQALYRRLSSSNRSKLHRALGASLMPFCAAGKRELASELALHFEEGRDYEQATRCLLLAAENAATRFSYRDSIQILRHALELVPALQPDAPAELEIQIFQRIGDAHFVLGEMSDSAASYEAAAKRAADARLKIAHIGALARLGFPAWFLDSARGNEVCRQVLEVSGTLDDPLLVAQTRLAVAGFRLLYDSWREEDAEICAPARETIRRLSGSSIVHDVYSIYVQALQGEYLEAHRHADGLIGATTNPTAYMLGCGAKGLIFLFCGEFGELLRVVRTGLELAEKNGEDAWMYILGDVWLRAACFDFEGVGRMSSTIMRSDVEPHAVWIRTVSRISSAYAELYRGNHDAALQGFRRVCDRQVTPTFFLHWHWRMHAMLGAAETRLSMGDVANARREADGLLQAALSTADPNIQALAWATKSQVARAERDLGGARRYISNALAILDRYDIPPAAWRVHAAASEVFGEDQDTGKARAHYKRAQDLVMRVADSFESAEPLRESLLSAPPVRRLFEQAVSA